MLQQEVGEILPFICNLIALGDRDSKSKAVDLYANFAAALSHQDRQQLDEEMTFSLVSASIAYNTIAPIEDFFTSARHSQLNTGPFKRRYQITITPVVAKDLLHTHGLFCQIEPEILDISSCVRGHIIDNGAMLIFAKEANPTDLINILTQSESLTRYLNSEIVNAIHDRLPTLEYADEAYVLRRLLKQIGGLTKQQPIKEVNNVIEVNFVRARHIDRASQRKG